jgi:hypothetical protein
VTAIGGGIAPIIDRVILGQQETRKISCGQRMRW